MNLVSTQDCANKNEALAKASHMATTLQNLFPDALIRVNFVSEKVWHDKKTPKTIYCCFPDGEIQRDTV